MSQVDPLTGIVRGAGDRERSALARGSNVGRRTAKACHETGVRGHPGCIQATTSAQRPRGLRDALNDRNNVFALESEPPSLIQQFLSLRPDDAAFGFARDRDTAAPAKLEHAFISEGAQCPQHCVGMDAEDSSHVVGGRQALTGTDVAVCDVTTDLCSDLVVQGHAVVRSALTSRMVTSIVSP